MTIDVFPLRRHRKLLFSGVHPDNRCVQAGAIPDVSSEDGRLVVVSDLIDSWPFRADSDEVPRIVHLN